MYVYYDHKKLGGRPGRDRMIVGFTTTYAISAYHHWCCEFESRSVNLRKTRNKLQKKK